MFTFARAGYGSESEADDEAATVSLPSDVDKLNQASRKSAVRLQEIGPRMTMRLVKVEAGLCSGDVLYPWPGEFPWCCNVLLKSILNVGYIFVFVLIFLYVTVGKQGKVTEKEIEGQEETEDELEDGSEDEMEE